MAIQVATRSVRSLMEDGELRSVFQPIVDLRSGRTVGREALARGPKGTEFEMPGALFGSAIREGILGEFDRACRGVALSTALASGRFARDLLFLNVEPAALDLDEVLDPVDEGSLADVAVVIELTERALAARPSEVLAAVTWLRERGCRIALDDVGIDPRSLALMPFLAPDLIKLDLRLTQGLEPATETAHVLHAVRAEAERSGAVVLAEGIETEEHRRRALAMGARLGQGYLFGRPVDLEEGESTDVPSDREAGFGIPRRPLAERRGGTPFERIADPYEIIQGDKRLLLSLSHQLEDEARMYRGETVVLATFQDQRFFTPAMQRRYERLARSSALVGALGVGMPAEPGEGVRGAALSPADDLAGEWDVVVVGPHFAGAFVARDLGDEGVADMDRRFEYHLTYERERVAEAARPLLERIVRSS